VWQPQLVLLAKLVLLPKLQSLLALPSPLNPLSASHLALQLPLNSWLESQLALPLLRQQMES
jgi:hypothetical protein